MENYQCGGVEYIGVAESSVSEHLVLHYPSIYSAFDNLHSAALYVQS
jgi:hypothetical protein